MSIIVAFERLPGWFRQQFELSRGGERSNVRPMEGPRGFAVFLVFLVHYVSVIDPWIDKQSTIRPLASALHTIGNTGVDLFFVLSGYLIYGSLIGRPQTYRRFMSRRLERIYPAFTAVFAVYVAFSFVVPEESKLPQDGFAAILYLCQNFLLLPGVFRIKPMITVAWSLSYEMFFYLTIPLVIAVLGLRARTPAKRALLLSTVAVAGAIYCAAAGGGPIRLTMFVSGMLLYEAIRNGRIPTPTSSVALTALVIGLLFTLVPVSGSQGSVFKTGILFLAFFVLCFAVFEAHGSWLARGFSWTPLRWLGNMSYSYYLLHGLTLKAAFLPLRACSRNALVWVPQHEVIFFWALLPPMFALTLVASAALFLAVERPFSLSPTVQQKGVPASAGPGAGQPSQSSATGSRSPITAPTRVRAGQEALSRLDLLEHPPERRAAKDVDVEMRHLLMGVGPAVGQEPIAAGRDPEPPCGLADRAEEAGDRLGRRLGAKIVH